MGKAPRARATTTSKIYWGAWIGSQLTGHQAPWDMSAVSAFEHLTGKGASIISFAAPFADCSTKPCSFYSFPNTPLENVRAHGSIPLISWSSQSTPSRVSEPDFQLSDVITGRYDAYIRGYAQRARQWGHPFLLRFDWEMNGNWFPWAEGVNGNKPGEYVAAWRHVHDIFTSTGAANVKWVWCPNVDPRHEWTNPARLYPGDAYVDWTCLDGYNWGTNPNWPWGWKTFDQLFGSSYQAVAGGIAPRKPMVIGEVGAGEQGGSKALWIANMLARVPTAYPKIRGLVWFERYDNTVDWPIESSLASSTAFALGIANPVYAANSLAQLTAASLPATG